MTATFTSRLSAEGTPLKHAWEHTIGSGHAPLALRADWQEQLRRCHDELGFRHVRFHGLLSDDMGTLVAHEDKPLYSFFNANRIRDFLLSIGMCPFVELSFMPEMTGRKFDFTGKTRSGCFPAVQFGRSVSSRRMEISRFGNHRSRSDSPTDSTGFRSSSRSTCPRRSRLANMLGSWGISRITGLATKHLTPCSG